MKTFKALLRTEYLLTIRSLSSLVLSIGMPVYFLSFLLFFCFRFTNYFKAYDV